MHIILVMQHATWSIHLCLIYCRRHITDLNESTDTNRSGIMWFAAADPDAYALISESSDHWYVRLRYRSRERTSLY